MTYRIYKKRIIKQIHLAGGRCKNGFLCSLTLKILPISVVFLIGLSAIYIFLISFTIITNVSKISAEKINVAFKNEIALLENTVLNKKQNLNRENVMAMGFSETQKTIYLSTKKTVSISTLDKEFGTNR